MNKIEQLNKIINEPEGEHSKLGNTTNAMFEVSDTAQGPTLCMTLTALKRAMLELISYDWATDNNWTYGGGIGVQGKVTIFSYNRGEDIRPIVTCRVSPKDGCEFRLILDTTNMSEEAQIFYGEYGVIELKKDLTMLPPFMSALQSIALIERVIEEHNEIIQKKKKQQ